MKVALACDSSSVKSYICKQGYVYTFDGQPYNRVHHIKNECLMGFWNYPLLFDGYFINLTDASYPIESFDIIFAAIERDINYLDVLRTMYPNATIVGTIKEAHTNTEIRNELIRRTDSFVIPYLTFDFFKEYGYDYPTTLHKIPQPVNIEYLRQHFYTNKCAGIFNYANTWVSGRSGRNSEFLSKISYTTKYSQQESWHDFIKDWHVSKYMINTDPSNNFGQQATQCAAIGTVMIGGCNDSHKILYPELAHCDIDKLIDQFIKMETDSVYYQSIVDYAMDTVYNIYSFDTIRLQIQNIK